MLTLILLVVLGGGVGLMAVSLAESPKPATDVRPGRREPDAPDDRDEPDEPDVPDDTIAPVSPPDTGPTDVPESGPHTASRAVVPAPPAPQVAPAPTLVVDTGPPRRRSRGDVPKAYTAVEGRYRDVARAPLWRRVLSLVLIVAIAAICGVVIAAVLGAVIAAVSEVLGNTIG